MAGHARPNAPGAALGLRSSPCSLTRSRPRPIDNTSYCLRGVHLNITPGACALKVIISLLGVNDIRSLMPPISYIRPAAVHICRKHIMHPQESDSGARRLSR